MRIEGKLVLVTGAGSGIGRALAIEASRRGAALVLVGRRETPLKETRDLLGEDAACALFPGDITLPATRRKLREQIAAMAGRLDILVNNAGVIAAGPLAAESDRAIEALVATNLVAPMTLTREMLPLLAAAAPSRVVNMGSILGDIGYPLFAAYSASKFGLRGFSMALRRELRGTGIGVTYGAPRATWTNAASAFSSLIAPMGMQLDDADTVARNVWEAVAQDANVSYPAGQERFFVLLQRLIPALIDRVLAGQLEQPMIRGLLARAMPWAMSQNPRTVAPLPEDGCTGTSI